MEITENLTTALQLKRVSIKKEVVAFLTKKHGFICTYCACDLSFYGHHVDHIMPVSKGGDDSLGNLCLACPQCNGMAGGRLFASLEEKKRFILSRPPKPKNPISERRYGLLNPPPPSKNVMIRMPLDLFDHALAQANEMEYTSFNRFIVDIVKLGLNKKKPVSK